MNRLLLNVLCAVTLPLSAGAGQNNKWYDIHGRDGQILRRVQIVSEDDTLISVRSEYIAEPLSIRKKDLIKPPVLVAESMIAEEPISSLETPTPKSLDANMTDAPEPGPNPAAARLWQRYAVGFSGVLLTREIRTDPTAGFGFFARYSFMETPRAQFRLFVSVSYTELINDSFLYSYLPVNVGIHSLLLQPRDSMSIYADYGFGFGRARVTRTEADRNFAAGNLFGTVGYMYFPWNFLSLNAEITGIFVTGDHPQQTFLRLQFAAVGHY